MPLTVQDILDIIETIAPANLAESWDNVGLMVGDPAAEVSTILLGLDPTIPLLDEAEALAANLVITHHPPIFHPLQSVRFEHPDGRFLRQAIRGNINVISCHTNLDAAKPGVSDILADRLGLAATEPLSGQGDDCSENGIGRIGNFNEPVTADGFIRLLGEACSPSWLLEAGPRPERITRAAVCGGSCSDLAEAALGKGAQVFVTSEVKHNIARWAEQAGLWIIDAGHFPTENPGMENLARLLRTGLQRTNHPFDIRVTARQTSPLRLVRLEK